MHHIIDIADEIIKYIHKQLNTCPVIIINLVSCEQIAFVPSADVVAVLNDIFRYLNVRMFPNKLHELPDVTISQCILLKSKNNRIQSMIDGISDMHRLKIFVHTVVSETFGCF